MNFENLNINEYLEQLTYFANYYGSDFRIGQGTEELLERINSFSKKGSLIDFGSGSNIYFWLMAFNEIEKVTCVDISRESLYVNEQVRNKILFPKSVIYPKNKYGKDYNQILKIDISYIIKNVFIEPLEEPQKYDNVSQFGLLGLSQTKENYIENFSKLFELLEEKGIFIGANWMFSSKYAEKKSFSNNYLNKELIQEISEQFNCNILKCDLVPIKDDENYDYVLIYVLEKK